LKITKIETIRLRSRATLIWVRIHTDEGLVGLGESWLPTSTIALRRRCLARIPAGSRR
jgi:L-alanine-DL-glutamate epimerase-like enolase superfamily enzyme